jgi:DNA-binding NarL/FixJ family response regulator
MPELNHNEMTGFDVIPKTKQLSEKFHFLFLSDESDHKSVLKRMSV